ncbi:MAG: cyanophycin synthetase, partial [Deltaproteobacteria bacterium]|nr:cyanophycin synthetase [Deltaproteobacteria bacterium]
AEAAARGFDKILIREDFNLRGRRGGEVASLICSAVARITPNVDCRVILDERAALKTAVREMIPNEVVVLFFDDLDVVRPLLDEVQAVPVASIHAPAPPRAA